jgi:hypothetical protein
VNEHAVSSLSYSNGGGIYTLSNSSITMNDNALVAGNKARNVVLGYTKGGGIYLGQSMLTMNGNAAIMGNEARGGTTTATTAVGAVAHAEGGGIYAYASVVTMNNGSITDNTARGGTLTAYTLTAPDAHAAGGGVYTTSPFYMNGGTIARNKAIGGKNTGGDTKVCNTMYGAGGGVCIDNTQFYMQGGSIENNIAGESGADYSSYGGAIYTAYASNGGQIRLSGPARIPAGIDITPDDTEDSRNTIALLLTSGYAGADSSNQNAKIFITDAFTDTGEIIVDIRSNTAAGTIQTFTAAGTRPVFVWGKYPGSPTISDLLPGRFRLGHFIEYITAAGEGQYKWNHSDISASHEIGTNGLIKAKE